MTVQMNKEHVLQAAEWVEENAQFDMWSWADGHPPEIYPNMCDTPACVAGTITFRVGGKVEGLRSVSVFNIARNYLGVTERVANDLFVPDDVELGSITATIAAATLRHFAETGKVDYILHGATGDTCHDDCDYEYDGEERMDR